MRVPPGIMDAALLRNADNLAKSAVTGLRKRISTNEGWSLTSGELINSFMAEGLSRAGYGAAIGAGAAWLSGGSPLEGARQGAFYGAGYGTLRNLSANRAALARRAFGIDAGTGFLSGLRATQRVNELARGGAQAIRRAAREADLAASRATSSAAASLRELSTLRRSGATAEQLQAAMARFREAGTEWAAMGGTAEAANLRRLAVEGRLDYTARRLGLVQ